jgi:hypothetical protein
MSIPILSFVQRREWINGLMGYWINAACFH